MRRWHTDRRDSQGDIYTADIIEHQKKLNEMLADPEERAGPRLEQEPIDARCLASMWLVRGCVYEYPLACA